MKLAVQKVCVIRLMHLPDEICDEIISFLFYKISEITKTKKRELNGFIERYIIRYEENNPALNMSIWGISFFPYDKFQIQNMNCTLCGDFLFSRYDKKARRKSCKCIIE